MDPDGSTGSAGVPSRPDPTVEQPSLFDAAVRRDALARELREGFAYLAERGTTTASEVCDSVVFPVLAHLGWDVGGESSAVLGGLETAAGAVDVALCHPPGEPKVLVRIGAVPEMGDGATPSHPSADCTLRAIQLAVSADARVWRLYFPADRASVRDREFARVGMPPDADGLTILRRYLAFHAVRLGEAFRQARREYRRIRFPAEALRAWRRILSGEELVERFSREMEEATGVAPDREQAEQFVSGQLSVIRWPADPPDPAPARRVKVGDRVWIYDPGRGRSSRARWSIAILTSGRGRSRVTPPMAARFSGRARERRRSFASRVRSPGPFASCSSATGRAVVTRPVDPSGNRRGRDRAVRHRAPPPVPAGCEPRIRAVRLSLPWTRPGHPPSQSRARSRNTEGSSRHSA